MRVAIALHFLRRDDDHIDGRIRAGQVTINLGCDSSPVKLAPLDDQEIKVAVRSHLPAGGRPEQDDLVGLGRLDDTPDDVGKDLALYRAFLGANVVAGGAHC